MRVTIDHAVTAKQATLTDWQRDHLLEAARGESNRWRGHHRLAVIDTGYGFDIVGLKKVHAMNSDGEVYDDAWAVAWADECYPDTVHCDTGKYRRPPTPRPHYTALSEADMPTRRRHRRWRRRERERKARQQAWIRSELDRLNRELADWEGSPYSFPEYDKLAQLQQLLED